MFVGTCCAAHGRQWAPFVIPILYSRLTPDLLSKEGVDEIVPTTGEHAAPLEQGIEFYQRWPFA